MGHYSYYLMILVAIFSLSVSAERIPLNDKGETIEVSPRKKKQATGRKAAARYMNRKVSKSKKNTNSSSREPAAVDRAHFMMVHIGTFLDSQAYQWGKTSGWDDKARLNLGVTYRFGEWTNSMDLLFRGEFNTFSFDGESPYKISFMPVIMFPDASSEFPLYFGAGGGLGVFFKQVSAESSLSIDFTIFGGVRFFDVFEFGGLFGEVGLKNHVHFLSDGQFNGVYISTGMIFSF